MKVSIVFIRAILLLSVCHVHYTGASFYTPMYVPTLAELAQIDLAHVVHGSNAAHTDDWQRLFVLASLESRHRAAAMRGCQYRVRLKALGETSALIQSPDTSRLHELGCTLRLDEHGVGECHLAVPTSLALVNTRRLVALSAEVVTADQEAIERQQTLKRCQWPDQDLFTATLVPYATQLACAHEHFWSEDAEQCVSCELVNDELVANVCGLGQYIRGCDAISHLDSDITDECQACQDNGNDVGVFEWLNGVCRWQCIGGYFLSADARCIACSTSLASVCAATPGQEWQACSRETDEMCVPCAPILRGLYSDNERFVPAGAADSSACQTACKPGHFRNSDDHSCRVFTSVANLRLSLDLQLGLRRDFHRFEAGGGAQDSTAVRCDSAALENGTYTGDAGELGAPCVFACESGFHAIQGQCIQCDTPVGPDGAPLPPAAVRFTSTDCAHECRADAKYVLRNASGGAGCVFCDESACPTGEFLSGASCSECLACTHMSLAGGVFASRGTLDNPSSCAETCLPGFFEDFDQCLAHSALVCAPDEYLVNGTASLDASCMVCATCAGERLLQACGEHTNARCAPCPSLLAHEVHTDTQCSVACVSGALRNAAGVCEACEAACEPGHFRNYSSQHNCSQCSPCPPLPANGNFTGECAWTCAPGYTFAAGPAACVPESPSDTAPPAAPERRIICASFEFLDAAYQCRACSELEIQTPDSEGLGVRWRWKVWGEDVCGFECIDQYYQYSRSDGSKFCYTDTEYTSHVLLLNHQLSPVFLALAKSLPGIAEPKDPAEPVRLDSSIVFMCAAAVMLILAASLLI